MGKTCRKSLQNQFSSLHLDMQSFWINLVIKKGEKQKKMAKVGANTYFVKKKGLKQIKLAMKWNSIKLRSAYI